MFEALPHNEVFADLIGTQLHSAVVYSAFVRHTRGEECRVWSEMLAHEIDHSRYLQEQLVLDDGQLVELPPVRFHAFHECVKRALEYYRLSALERVELALRIEHAEIDYGLEGLLLGHRGHRPLPQYAHGVKHHYTVLVKHAERYLAAREIALQVERLYEHFPELRR